MKERPLFFGIVQGGLDEGLRLESLKIVQSLPVDGIAIGGLSVGEPRADMHSMLSFLAPHLDPKRPHYLMGVGDPVDVRHAIECGIDMMDCVLPTRNARHATVWVAGDKKIHLTNEKYATDPGPIDEHCDCHTCTSGYSRAFLRHQFKVGEPLSRKSGHRYIIYGTYRLFASLIVKYKSFIQLCSSTLLLKVLLPPWRYWF